MVIVGVVAVVVEVVVVALLLEVLVLVLVMVVGHSSLGGSISSIVASSKSIKQ